MPSRPPKRVLAFGALTVVLAVGGACGSGDSPVVQGGVVDTPGVSDAPYEVPAETFDAPVDTSEPAGDHFVDTHADRDCGDFSGWREAQEYFESMDGDPDGLDRDNDGIACETLR